ncbi:MAG TPA: M13 family metallopeptidase [Longimicrobiaceae bacterium]|nr:M13 family metallopeptidase [Longimicrobiaceae bacterium]
MTLSFYTRWLSGALGAVVLTACAAPGPQAPAAAAPAPRALALGIDTAGFDRSVRPQDDFFRFANGGWLKNTEIPADRGSFGSFTILREQSDSAVRALVERAAATPDRAPGSDLQKVGDLYLSYMDTVRIEALGIAPVQPQLRRIAALSDRGQLPELFAQLQREGVQTPFGFGVRQDPKNATRYIASVGQGGLGLPDRDYYLKSDASLQQTLAAYERYAETLFRLAGEPDPARAAKAVVALESRLAAKHWDRARSRDREATYNLKTVAELDRLTPGFSWTRFLDAAGAASTPGVVVSQPDYLQALDTVLAQTPLPALRQYLTFKVLDAAAPVLPSRFAKARFDFRGRVLSGQEAERPRWTSAVATVNGTLGEVAGRLYVEKHFTPAQKTRMQELVDNLVAAYREGIDQLEWMSPETKAEAQAKLARFNVKIGYPDEWRDYSALEIRPDDVAGNLRRASEWRFAEMVDRLGKPIDRGAWAMTPQTVNAYYSSTMNEIVFPAAILQPPFFNPDADDAVNYGAIGAVIGHEISHGFDDQGSRSDGEGNLRNWFTEADLNEFKRRGDVLVGQYSGYEPIPGTPINGRLTLGENIGDLSGVAMAYKAYRRSLNGREAPVIAGFTGDQRFFLGFAQIWRTKEREATLRRLLLSDSHSPGEFRTNVPLKNIPEFYTAFGVKEGDGMYLPPQQRVKVW